VRLLGAADGTIGLVLSGGGARGAYEFGALEVLAPVLDDPARIIVGTSSGRLGAAYLAANAQDGLEAAARSGGEKWLEVEIGDAIGPLCSPRELARLLLYGLELLGIRACAAEPARHEPATGDNRGADRL
jgi:NTE family protein